MRRHWSSGLRGVDERSHRRPVQVRSAPQAVAAVNAEELTGDPGRLVSGQVTDGCGDVVDRPGAAQRRVREVVGRCAWFANPPRRALMTEPRPLALDGDITHAISTAFDTGNFITVAYVDA